MTSDRLIDKIKIAILTKEANEFERFVTGIYRIVYGPRFLGVASGGGDLGNDGYDGHLLIQVYGPKSVDAARTVEKIEHDFYRAKDHWIFEEWHFVLNTKNDDAPARVVKKIDELDRAEPDIEIRLVDSKRLEDMIHKALRNHRYEVYLLLFADGVPDTFDDFGQLAAIVDFLATLDDAKRVEIGHYIYFDKERFYQGNDKKITINITENTSFRSFFHEVVNRSRLLMERYKDDIGEEPLDRAGEEIKRIYHTLQRSGSSEEAALIGTFEEIYGKMEKDYNSYMALWIVMGYFFDLCDIGRKPDGDGQ